MAVSKSHSDKIAQPDGLALLAIRSDERRKSREHLANAREFTEFNRRYVTVPDIGDIIRRSRRSAKIAIAAIGYI